MTDRIRMALVLLLLPVGSVLAEQHMAFIDMEALFQGYYKTFRNDAKLRQKKDLVREYRENLIAEIELLRTQRDENKEAVLNIALSDEARAKHRQEMEEKNGLYQEKLKEFQEFRRKAADDMQRFYRELREEIVKELLDHVREYAKAQDIGTVLDVSGRSLNGIPSVIRHPESLDITEALLAKLNEGHEAEVEEAANRGKDEEAPAAGLGLDQEKE